MALAKAINFYTRENIVSMLRSLSFEDKRWTLDYLVKMLSVPSNEDNKASKKHTALTDEVMQQARAMSVSGNYSIPADEDGRDAIADIKYKAV